MSLSCLTCHLAPRRDAADDLFAGEQQPQTATGCGAMRQGCAADGPPSRYALLRTTACLETDSSGGSGGKRKTRKCKSAVIDVSQLVGGPQLRRSGGVRRDWSFEDLTGGGKDA